MDRLKSIFDTSPSKRFPTYTRAVVGAAMPAPCDPIIWDLLDSTLEHGWRQAFITLGVFDASEFEESDYVVSAIFRGYFYQNLTIARLAAERFPGMSAADLERTWLGRHDVSAQVNALPDAQAPEPAKIFNAIDSVLSGNSFDEARAMYEDAKCLRQSRPQFANASITDLIGRLDRLAQIRARLNVLINIFNYLGPYLATRLQSEVAKRGADDEVVSSATNLVMPETGLPSAAAASLARQVANSRDLTKLFNGGVHEVARAFGRRSVDSFFANAFEDVRLTFGYCGPRDYDLMAPTWETDPTLLLQEVDRLRHIVAREQPDKTNELAAAEGVMRSGAFVDPVCADIARHLNNTLRARERLRASAGYINLEVRLIIQHFGADGTMQGRIGAASDIVQLRRAELHTFFTSEPGTWIDELSNRSRLKADLSRLVPPFIIHGTMPDANEWIATVDPSDGGKARDTLKGIAASPGRSRGTARIVSDPTFTAFKPGEVLVAESTDPSWTPLLSAACAVVTETGGVFSHTSIVARELGIPAVVSVRSARALVRDGTSVLVDGTAGIVKLD